MLHFDAPEEVKIDPNVYAQWRVEHLDEKDLTDTASMPVDKMLAMYTDEFWEAIESTEDIANENAAIEALGAKKH